MKKEPQIGVRVGLPAFFALELEEVYRHTAGAHRALAFPDFVGLLVGMGLEAYRKLHNLWPTELEETPEDTEEDEPLHLFDMDPTRLPDLFREFEQAMKEQREDHEPRLQLVHKRELA